MKSVTFMLIAGEASGDLLAAELVRTLRKDFASVIPSPTSDFQPLQAGLEPRFFGAGGPRMAEAGVEIAFDLTAHSVIGLEAFKQFFKFRRLFHQLLRLARERTPAVIVCVDFQMFNRRFAQAIRRLVDGNRSWFKDWNPLIVQYVSPQVWASRPWRADGMPLIYDLLLSILPFEKAWYARRVPKLQVEFVGHPIMDRYAGLALSEKPVNPASSTPGPAILLLPGSRSKELSRHLPVMLGALSELAKAFPKMTARLVVPNQTLADQAKTFCPPEHLQIQIGGLPAALSQADIAIASTGTVTMECAYFQVPTVAIYKTSWSTYQLGKRLITVRFLAMPNILANEEVFPEFIQDRASPHNIARATIGLLNDPVRRMSIKAKLREIAARLGGPGAAQRAARAILDRLG